MPRVDFVIPVFNEEESVSGLHDLLEHTSLLDAYTRQYIYVNDGSSDSTQQVLERLAEINSNLTIIRLSRNFGHQAALSAGLDVATGDVVVTMDGDGQHPPSLIPEMLRLHKAGYDIVQAQRLDDSESGFFKRVTSESFYRLLSIVGEVDLRPGTSDFRLLSRPALEALKEMPEYHRFLRGMTVWIGFPSVILPYKPAPRLGGTPKYSLRKMIRLAADGFFSFSLVPLRVGLLLGTVFVALAAVELSYIAFVWFRGHQDQLVPGWTSLVLILTVSSAINMILQGILGIYVGMVFREVKRRPVYIVRSKTGSNL
jgi:polyisoprenyl-phosphate glycosyltransferase